MSSDEFEYVDEDGNPLTAEEVAAMGDDVEIVEEAVADAPAPAAAPVPAAAPSAPAPTAAPATQEVATGEAAASVSRRRIPKAAVAVVAAVALAVGGGAAYGLHAIGSQHTAEDVKDAAADKTDHLKTTATQRRDDLDGRVNDATHPPVDICADVGKARLDKTLSIGAPALQLRIIRSAPLPSELAKAKQGLEILQLSTDQWGIYAPQPVAPQPTETEPFARQPKPKEMWWKAPVATGANALTAGAAVSWPGGDSDAPGACPAADPGTYAVVGDVPPGAKGLREGQAEVTAIRGDATTATPTTGTATPTTTETPAVQSDSQNRVVAVMGSSVVVAALEDAPEPTTEGR